MHGYTMQGIRQDPGHRDSTVNGDHDVCDGTEDGGLEDAQEEETHGDFGEGYDGFVNEGEGVEVLVCIIDWLVLISRERGRGEGGGRPCMLW